MPNAYANETNPRHRGTPRSTTEHHHPNLAVAVYRVEFLEQRSSAFVRSAPWHELCFFGQQTVLSYGASLKQQIQNHAVMSDMKLTVQSMQHESVIAHTYACSVDAVALWPDIIANAI